MTCSLRFGLLVSSLASHTLCVISEPEFIIECYAQHLLGGYLLLPADSYRIGAQCIHVLLLVHSSVLNNIPIVNLYNYFIQYIYSN
jgi:hypothetical protein